MAKKNFAKKTSGENESYWIQSQTGKAYTRLAGNASADVVVVGAGIAGLTTAYLLAKAGKKAIVLEDGNIGSGETGRTTAHITHALDDRYYDLIKYFGKEKIRMAAESHTAAIDLIESIVQQESIDCDFERLDGYLFLHPTDSVKSLEEELRAVHDAGLVEVTRQAKAPLPFDAGLCLRFPRQAQFHPMKYLNALAEAFIKAGGEIYTSTRVMEVDGEGVTTADGVRVLAKAIVVATNTPINDRFRIHTKQAPYRTYVIAVKIPRGSVERGLYWDTGDQNESPAHPYHYLRLQKYDENSDLMIVGGEDHKTGQAPDTEEPFLVLESWTREKFPMAEEIIAHWSGQVMEPVDMLAYIGRNPGVADNIFICTGDSGNGITHGTIAGMLNTDLILGKENPWADVYEPSRKTLRSASDYIQENINVAKQYADYVRPADIKSTEQLLPGQGGIMKHGARPVAVYRDDHSALSGFSAVCPHAGCVVHWNQSEKTFDCPCHGSRFTSKGEVINGPADRNLEPVEVKELSRK